MRIDCDTCIARDIACSDCVVSVLLRSPAPTGLPAATRRGVEPMDLDADEQAAIGRLAYVGLVPPLRLVSPPDNGATGLRSSRRGIA